MSTDLLPMEHERSDTSDSVALDHMTSQAITSAVLRATGIVLLMSLAVIHIVQLVPTFQQSPLLGVGYLFVIGASVVVGARLVKGDQSVFQLWLPVAGLGVAVFLGYAFTRMLSTPLDNQDVGNWSCTLGMASLFVEGLMVAVAAYAISLGRAVFMRPLALRNGSGSGS